jgi:hypothetical protein
MGFFLKKWSCFSVNSVFVEIFFSIHFIRFTHSVAATLSGGSVGNSSLQYKEFPCNFIGFG